MTNTELLATVVLGLPRALGKEGFDEADVMRLYLLRAGIPDNRILLDHDGKTTFYTAQNTAALMKSRGWTQALVISQFFHLSRTRLAFHRAGIAQVYTAHANYFVLRDLYSLVRERIGYVYCSLISKR